MIPTLKVFSFFPLFPVISNVRHETLESVTCMEIAQAAPITGQRDKNL